ncbi:LPS-assembly protein LptD [Amantichitinum ursilacus]|uniref:LPS-assembly protein LptD n=1 Tax=Amantichitinum ursilacus TaxID=857265 RepID=UPI0013791CD7
MEGTQPNTLKATGDVHIVKGDEEYYADWADYDDPSQHIKAGDKVRMEKNGAVMTGRDLDYFIDRAEGTMQDPEYQFAGGVGRGDAVDMLFNGQNKYRFNSGRFTTCPVQTDDWYIHAQHLDIDYNINKGEATNAWLEFKGTPILYMPWMNFPLDDGRQTGFLSPALAINNRNGIDVTLPFYWNIAPNYDATIYPRYFGKRGLMVGAEFRYLQPNYAGTIRADYLDDKEADAGRYDLYFKHAQKLADRLSLSLDIEKVSDDNYFNDFGDRAAVASQTNLPRQGILTYAGDGWSSSLNWLHYQTLQNATHTNDIPYALSPQLTFSTAPKLIDGVQTNFSAEFTNFTSETKTNGYRTWVYPSVSMPFIASYGFVTPKIGVHATNYQLSSPNGDDMGSQNRVLPIMSVDSGLVFERDLNIKDEGFVQTLEPRVYYLYIPYKNQSNLPNFDSAQTDFSYSQLFSENRYTGNDRINDANEITLALTSRLFETDTGIERLRATVGQRFYFSSPQVSLDSTSLPETNKSDLLVSLGGQVWRNLNASYDLQYDLQQKSTGYQSVGLNWAPGEQKVLNVRYVLNRTVAIEQLDVSGQWPVSQNWYALGHVNYSLLTADKKPLDTLLGLEYNGGCWGLRLAAQRYVTSDGGNSNTYYFLLQLGALGGLGTNPVSTLRQAIPGYTDIFPTK